jgi:release factor glutamine methyltransferase
MTWKNSLDRATHKLAEAGVEDARANAEYLAAHILSLNSRSELRAMLDRGMPDTQADDFNQLIARREQREPLQYILGEWEFFGLPIKVGSEALIPRPETEILVEQALREAAKMPTNISVLDLGTGTGCIALAIAKQLPSASVVGIDISSGAVELASENARLLDLPNASFKVADILSDEWMKSIATKFDLIVSNPPYIGKTEFETLEPELRNYEPRRALTDESDGLTFYRRIAALAPMLLTSRGRLLVEVGYGASDAVVEIMRSAGLGVIRVVNDLAGIPRVVVAGLPSNLLKC